MSTRFLGSPATTYGLPALCLLLLGSHAASAARPLELLPANPHYFLFRGKPTIVLTSGEHYGAVLNLDFDYRTYLDTLAKDGLNGTRVWSGAYCEPPTAFTITSNTLAPLPGRFICPWARSPQAGYANGGNKFDLAKWDAEYFKRLKAFVAQAGKRGIIVELNLFCPFYEDGMWRLSPMNAANNINGVGLVARTNVYTLDQNDGLLAIQEAMVRKLARGLRKCDNLYYEICNEPYFGGVNLAWQHHIAQVIVEAETQLGVRHLISQNIANHQAKIVDPHPAISIFNFHYCYPPETVVMNFDLNKVIGENETGFRGTNDAPYRMEAWDFLLAGGGLYNNLDYSFTVGHEDGTFVYPASQPGGGSPTLRQQLGYLRKFISELDFCRMRPANEVITGALPPGVRARALVKPDQDYAVYVATSDGKASDGKSYPRSFPSGELILELALPAGDFTADWLDTKQGWIAKHEPFTHSGGGRNLTAPAFERDVALVVHRVAAARPIRRDASVSRLGEGN